MRSLPGDDLRRKLLGLVSALVVGISSSQLASHAYAQSLSVAPELPEPFTLTLEAKRLKLPDPFEITLEAKRLKLPDPFEITLEAKRLKLPDPFEITLEAKRLKLPDTFEITLEAKRLKLPDPFEITLEASRASCHAPQKSLDTVSSLIDKGQLGAADTALAQIDTAACPNVAKGAAEQKARIASQIAQLDGEVRTAGQRCVAGDLAVLAAKLREADHPELSEARAKVDQLSQSVVEAQEAYKQAATQFIAGDFIQSLSDLQRARTTLAGAGVGCPDLAKRIASAVSIAETTRDNLAKVDAAIASCDAQKMASYSQRIKALARPHPLLAAKVAELDGIAARITRASAAFEKANGQFAQGKLKEARAGLDELEAELLALKDNQACPDLRKKIASGMKKIAVLEGVLGKADAAIRDCAMDDIRDLHARFSKNPTHLLIREKTGALEQAQVECAGNAVEAVVTPQPEAAPTGPATEGWEQPWRGQITLTHIVADGEEMSVATALSRYVPRKPRANPENGGGILALPGDLAPAGTSGVAEGIGEAIGAAFKILEKGLPISLTLVAEQGGTFRLRIPGSGELIDKTNMMMTEYLPVLLQENGNHLRGSKKLSGTGTGDAVVLLELSAAPDWQQLTVGISIKAANLPSTTGPSSIELVFAGTAQPGLYEAVAYEAELQATVASAMSK